MLAAVNLGAARGVTPAERPHSRDSAHHPTRAAYRRSSTFRSKEIVGAIAHDKKIVEGALHFIAATEIGQHDDAEGCDPEGAEGALKAIGIKKA